MAANILALVGLYYLLGLITVNYHFTDFSDESLFESRVWLEVFVITASYLAYQLLKYFLKLWNEISYHRWLETP